MRRVGSASLLAPLMGPFSGPDIRRLRMRTHSETGWKNDSDIYKGKQLAFIRRPGLFAPARRVSNDTDSDTAQDEEGEECVVYGGHSLTPSDAVLAVDKIEAQTIEFSMGGGGGGEGGDAGRKSTLSGSKRVVFSQEQVGEGEEEEDAPFDLGDDMSHENLLKIFKRFDKDGDGQIPEADFRKTLQFFLEGSLDEGDFLAVWAQVRSRCAVGEINFSVFCDIIKRIKLLWLYSEFEGGSKRGNLPSTTSANHTYKDYGGAFPPPRADTSLPSPSPPAEKPSGHHRKKCLSVIEYAPDYYSKTPVMDFKQYMARQEQAFVNVRWVGVQGIHRLTIRALGIHHNLHPLVVEDLLSLGQRPKYDPALGMFVVMAFRRSSNVEWKIDCHQVTIVMLKDSNAPPSPDLVLSTTSLSRDDEENLVVISNPSNGLVAHPLSPLAKTGSAVASPVTQTIVTVQDCEGDIWEDVRRRLAMYGSRVRDNNSWFLVYTLLDAIFDQLFPIVEVFNAHLEEIEFSLHHNPRSISNTNLTHVYAIRKEMYLLRRYLRPMREVVSRFRNDCVDETMQPYVTELTEHAGQVLDSVEQCVELCKSLQHDYVTAQDQKQNEVLYVLTMITAIFVPGQFLAGVYGMNFKFMPELGLEYGYWLFWGLIGVILIVVLTFFKYKKYI